MMDENGKKPAVVAQAFKAMKHPPKVGQIRRKRWACVTPPEGPQDPLWTERCRRYWQHQEQVYGLKFGSFAFYYDQGTVVSESYIERILPGQRVDT